MLRFILYLFTDVFGFCYFVLPVLLSLAGQLLLCFRTRRLLYRAIPLFVSICSILIVLILSILVPGLYVLLPLGLAGLLLLGSLFGWLTYACTHLFSS